MPTYEITAHAEGTATLTIDAADADEAERIAYAEHLTGIFFTGGESTWVVDDVREASNGA